MRAPAIQLYFRDWMSHPGLRMCSIAARGLWADMMCIMAEGTPYGYLAVRGKGIHPAVLARRVGEALPDVERWMAELEEHEVYARDANGVIYSPRMVRAEELRQVRAAGGHKSQGHPNVPPKKLSIEDEGKDIQKGAPKDTSRPSPAVAVAVASASTPSSPLVGEGHSLWDRFENPDEELAVSKFLEVLPDNANGRQWCAIIDGWFDGMGFNRGKAPLPADVAVGLTDYLAQDKRDFSVVHIRSFIQRAMEERIKRASKNGQGSSEEATRIWGLIKSQGIQHRTTQREIDAEVAALVTAGRVKDATEFKTILKKLDFALLRKAQQESFAVRHIAEKLNGATLGVA